MTSTLKLREVRDALVTMSKAAWATKSLVNALAYYPTTIDVAALPVAVVSIRNATYDLTEYGVGSLTENRNMSIIVHVAPLTLGSIGAAEIEVEDYIELFIEYFGARQYVTLSNGHWVELALVGDQGLQIIQYPVGDGNSLSFAGVTFELQIARVHDVEPAV